jgi:hypothetical protein
MIYFSGISTQHLNLWEFPDDTPRFSSVEDCYRLFLGIHFRMLRSGQAATDPYYNHYLACVDHFESRMRLSYQEFRNAVATIVDLYREYFDDTGQRRRQALLDTIGKFERLVYLFSNKTFPTRTMIGK